MGLSPPRYAVFGQLLNNGFDREGRGNHNIKSVDINSCWAILRSFRLTYILQEMIDAAKDKI